MSKVWLITKKELRSYFDSPAAYVLMVLFLVLTGVYVAGNIFLENAASLRLLFRVAPIVMLVFVPAVTMRLIAEEKQGGTFELLGTRPIPIGSIVVGKFFASWFLILCTILPTTIYAVILSILGRLDWGPVAGGYVGLFLLGGTFAAVGVFASALSNKQVVSLIVGTILVSCLFFLHRLLPFVPVGFVLPIEYLSVGYHFLSLERGILDSRDLIYGGTLIVFFLLLASVVTAREYGQSYREWRRLLSPAQSLRLVLVAVILMLTNLVSTVMFFRTDLTAEGRYTLSPATLDLLSSLDDDVAVRIYLTPDLPPPYHNYRRDIQDLFEEYHAFSIGKFQYRFVNALENPLAEAEATEAGVVPIFVKVVKNDRIQLSKAYAGLALSYGDRFDAIPIISSVDRLEYDLTNAIARLRTRTTPAIGLLYGHGGPGPESMRNFLDALEKHYRVIFVSLSDPKSAVPDVSALLIVGPRVPFAEREKALLDSYIGRGGRVAFFLGGVSIHHQQQVARRLDLNLDDMFDSYGWNVNDDLVIDKQCEDIKAIGSSAKLAQGDEGPNPFHPVVMDFDRNSPTFARLLPVVMPYVSSLDVRIAGARGIGASVVARSSSQSARLIGDSIDINALRVLKRTQFSEEHLPLAATFEGSFRRMYSDVDGKQGGSPPRNPVGGSLRGVRTKIAVVGDGDFVLDGFIGGYHNITFAQNVVDWLVDEKGLSAIRTREIAPPPLDEVSEGTRSVVKYLIFIAPPVIVIICGILRTVINASRRRALKESY